MQVSVNYQDILQEGLQKGHQEGLRKGKEGERSRILRLLTHKFGKFLKRCDRKLSNYQ